MFPRRPIPRLAPGWQEVSFTLLGFAVAQGFCTPREDLPVITGVPWRSPRAPLEEMADSDPLGPLQTEEDWTKRSCPDERQASCRTVKPPTPCTVCLPSAFCLRGTLRALCLACSSCTCARPRMRSVRCSQWDLVRLVGCARRVFSVCSLYYPACYIIPLAILSRLFTLYKRSASKVYLVSTRSYALM